MTQSRFNPLTFLHTHKHLLDGLDLLSVNNDFESLNDVRYYYLGTIIKEWHLTQVYVISIN